MPIPLAGGYRTIKGDLKNRTPARDTMTGVLCPLSIESGYGIRASS
jgi:hypothetical protein